MRQQDMIINPLPMRTWNRLKMNEATLSGVSPEGSLAVETSLPQTAPDPAAVARMENIPGGAGSAVDRLAEEADPDVFFLKGTGKGTQEPAILTLRHTGSGQTMNRIFLETPEDTEMTVYLDLGSEEGAQGLAILQTKAYLAKHSTLRLVQIEHTGRGVDVLSDIGARCEEGARFELVQLFLGGDRIWSGYETDLLGDESSCKTYIGYHLKEEQSLDMNYVARHRGRRSDSLILAAGALSDRSRKLFRGTLDFIKGGKTATGAEKEEVLLMNDEVVNQTIPLILCGEEDVAGSHGATIGKADEEVLFYLTSRGIPKENAYAMLAKAKLDGALAHVVSPELKEMTQKAIEEFYGQAE